MDNPANQHLFLRIRVTFAANATNVHGRLRADNTARPQTARDFPSEPDVLQ